MSSRVTGVILAAGPSERFDGTLPKQLASFRGEPLVRRVVRRVLASRLHQVLVVVGHRGPALAAVLAGLAVELVDNCGFESGQSTSVRCSLPHIEPAAEAAVFIPGDQPFLSAEIVNQLIEAHERTGAPIVIPTTDGERRSPVLIARDLFPELSSLEGDAGGRQIFARHEEAIVEISIADPLALRDIDTREDYEELLLIAGQDSDLA